MGKGLAIRTDVSAAILSEVAQVSEFIAGATTPPDHLQVPLLDELSEQIGRLVFTQIPEFNSFSTANAAVCSDMVENRRFWVRGHGFGGTACLGVQVRYQQRGAAWFNRRHKMHSALIDAWAG